MANIEPIILEVQEVVVEVNDRTRIRVVPFGVFSKVFEWLFSLLKMLGYEEIKIEVTYGTDREGDVVDTDSPNTESQ